MTCPSSSTSAGALPAFLASSNIFCFLKSSLLAKNYKNMRMSTGARKAKSYCSCSFGDLVEDRGKFRFI
jgi:hypothetical protein